MDENVETTGPVGEAAVAGGTVEPVAVVPAREWVEVLSLLLVGGAVALIGHYLLMAWALYDRFGGFVGGEPGRWDIILPVVSQGGSLLNALVIAAALGLVLVAPGPVGPWGRAALTGVSIVGVVVAALALVGIVEVVRPDQGSSGVWFGGPGASSGSSTLVERVAETLRWIPGLVVGGLSAWMAWRNLNDTLVPAEPGGPEDGNTFPEIDLGLDR